MTNPARRKKNSRLLIFLVLFILFCFSANLSALPFLTPETNHPPDELYSHFHQKQQFQPRIRPDKAEQHESLRLNVTGAQLACSEDDCSHHHHGCALKISYHLSAELQPELDVGAQVVCQARLDYTTSHGYHLKTERCSLPSDHTLHHQDHIDSTIVVEFQFSPYEQVVDAQVDSIHCHIEQAEVILESSLH
ncbi:MAG: hypothetical protein ACR2PB_00725 [Desulfocapsaceae bacterium]